MKLSLAQYVVWLGSIFLAGAVVSAVARRKLAAQLPIFSGYAWFLLVRDVVSFGAWHTGSLRFYGYLYWAAEVVGYVFAFLLILDFWKQGLQAYRGIWRLSRWVLALTFLVLLGVIQETTLFGQGAMSQGGTWLNDWLRLFARSVLFTQATFLLAFFFILGLFRVRVTALIRSLALCWFGYCIVRVGLYSERYFYGNGIPLAYDLLLPLSFPVLLGLWTFVVWRTPAEDVVELTPIFTFASDQRQVLVERMELLNNSLLRIWQG